MDDRPIQRYLADIPPPDITPENLAELDERGRRVVEYLGYMPLTWDEYRNTLTNLDAMRDAAQSQGAGIGPITEIGATEPVLKDGFLSRLSNFFRIH